MRKKIIKEMPELPGKDIPGELGSRWKAMSEGEKLRWREESEKLN